MAGSGSGLPTVKVELDQDGTGALWYDISKYVDLQESFTIRRGRNDQFSDIEATTLQMTLDNKDGRFTPGVTTYNPAGLRVDQQIRVTETISGYSIVRCQLFVQEWPVAWDGGFIGKSRITATDRLPRFARKVLKTNVEEEHLRYAPTGYWSMGEPVTATQATNYAPSSTQTLNLTGKSGAGVIFGQADGSPVDDLMAPTFYGEKYLSTPPYLPAMTQVTMSCFFSSTASTAFTTTNLMEIWGPSGWPTLALRLSNNQLVVVYQNKDTDNGGTVTSASVPSSTCVTNDGQLHHAACRITATTVDVYVDGVGVYALTIPGGPLGWAAGTAKLLVGRLFSGVIAHAAVFPGTQLGTTIAALAASGLTGFAGETPNARFTRLAAYAGLTTSQLSAETAVTPTLPYYDTNDQTLDQAFKDLAVAEGGLIFTQGNGVLRFQNRVHRQQQTAADLTFIGHDLAGDTQADYDMTQIQNYVTAQRPDGPQIVGQNVASIAAHGQFPADLGTLTLSTDNEVQAAVDWRCSAYAEPVARITSATVDALTSSISKQQWLMYIEISDRFSLSGMNTGSPAVGDLLVEGWTETVQAGRDTTEWTITYNLSPFKLESAWILEDVGVGILGTTTRLGR